MVGRSYYEVDGQVELRSWHKYVVLLKLVLLAAWNTVFDLSIIKSTISVK